jgi:glycosyltransferase involved in cell wall biosynthesis
MRIAFYAPLKPPGHAVASGDRAMAQALIAALRMRGHTVGIASHFRSYDAGSSGRQLRIRDIGQRLADRLLRRIEPAGRPELWFTYHLYHKAPDWIGPAVTTELGIPYVIAEASFAPKQAGGLWDLGHRAVADTIRRADRIFQPNPADAECVLPLIEQPERLVPLPPFLDTAPFHAVSRAESRSTVAGRLGLDADMPWLLAVAMMRDDQKLRSYRCLAQSLAMITDVPWRLVLAGDGPAKPTVQQLFTPFGERVRWVGIVEPAQLRQLYRSADIFVWPAVKEAYGMALLEAQAAGVPVIAGSGGGVPAVVAHGETGILTPEGDAAAFAEAARSLLTNTERREAMGRAAASRAAERHDIAQAADLLDRHLRELVSGRR